MNEMKDWNRLMKKRESYFYGMNKKEDRKRTWEWGERREMK
jgi:hypothetical protein